MDTYIDKDALASILTEGLNLGVVVVDTKYQVLIWNEWMERQSGIKAKEILGKNIFDKYPDIRKRKKDKYIKNCINNNQPFLLSSSFHKYLIPINNICKGDETLSMLQNVKIYPLSREQNSSDAIIIIEDVTNQVLHEKEVLRLNRVLRGIRNINQLITKVTSEEKLFKGACKILSEDIGYTFSWVGLIEEGSFDVKPVAFSGIKPELFEKLKVKWDDSEYGLGITGRAIKTGEPHHVDSIQEDSLSGPWHDFAAQAGYKSSCSLPLKVDGSVIGTMNTHSSERSVFYGEELKLLVEVVDDISFALMSMRERDKRRIVEEALALEKERLAVTLQSIGDGVIATDTKGRVLFMNAIAEDLTGWSNEDARGKKITETFNIVNEYSRKTVENPVNRVLETGMIVGLANHTILIARGGNEFIIGDSGAPIQDKEGEIIGVVLVFRDMTEKTKLENNLRQSQKMESIGTMAGGIAHDFNNILGIIIGNTELAIDDIPEWNPAKGSLEEIRAASLRAKDLVRHILTFSRKSEVEKKPMQVTPIMEDTLKLIRAFIPASVDIRHKILCNYDTILADPTQINQILMNLCTNASYAMREDGGVLELGLRNFKLENRDKELDLEPGHYVVLSVEDTGSGIDPSIIGRIFDPYFTSKGLGEGTGMGLSMVHGIVKNHDGAIKVKSTPGKGAVFEVFFPLTDAEAEPENKKIDVLPAGNENILFLDDEESLAKMVSRILEKLGYRVKTKTDPIEALALVRSEPDRFDLIITDMTMPGMTGDKLAKEILKINPDMPIILCTGFSDKVDAKKAKELGFCRYIEKPFSMSDLPIAIRKALDKK